MGVVIILENAQFLLVHPIVFSSSPPPQKWNACTSLKRLRFQRSVSRREATLRSDPWATFSRIIYINARDWLKRWIGSRSRNYSWLQNKLFGCRLISPDSVVRTETNVSFPFSQSPLWQLNFTGVWSDCCFRLKSLTLQLNCKYWHL